MDLMESVKRAVVDGVRLQVLGGHAQPIDGGTLCISAFFLIFSSRRKSQEEEITVSKILIKLITKELMYSGVSRSCTLPSATWSIRLGAVLLCSTLKT